MKVVVGFGKLYFDEFVEKIVNLLLLLIVFGEYEPSSKLVDTALVQSDINHGRISPSDLTTMYKLPI